MWSLGQNAKLSKKGQRFGQMDQYYTPDYLAKCRDSGPDGEGDEAERRQACPRCHRHYCTCSALLAPEHFVAWDDLRFGNRPDDEAALARLSRMWNQVSTAEESNQLLTALRGKFYENVKKINIYFR